MIYNEREQLMRFLVASKDAPEAARDEAANILKLADQTEELHRTAVARQRGISNERSEHQRSVGTRVVATLLDGKKPNIGTLADQGATLTAAHDEAERQVTIATKSREQVEIMARSLATRHREPLIAWVAARRIIQPHACGFTEHVTRELDALWRDLAVDLFPKRPDELHLPERWLRLPVVIDPMWPAEPRSGIAWCWAQIAEGRWEWSPHPNDRQHKPRLLRFTHLPTVIEPAPTIPKRPERGLRFGMGSA